MVSLTFKHSGTHRLTLRGQEVGLSSPLAPGYSLSGMTRPTDWQDSGLSFPNWHAYLAHDLFDYRIHVVPFVLL